jgi:uncharacterized membrane protein YhaH (DUF805 family)
MDHNAMKIGDMDKSWFYLSFEGRASRSQFWVLYFIPMLIAGAILGTQGVQLYVPPVLVLASLSHLISTINLTVIPASWVIHLILLWPSLAVSVKRLHDRNKSGWWFIIYLIPVIGTIWYFIEQGCLGPVDNNEFGDTAAPKVEF